MDQFWMVLGNGNPVYRHPSEQSARNEAQRLARINPGSTFFVLRAVAAVTVVDVQWTELDDAERDGPCF